MFPIVAVSSLLLSSLAFSLQRFRLARVVKTRRKYTKNMTNNLHLYVIETVLGVISQATVASGGDSSSVSGFISRPQSTHHHTTDDEARGWRRTTKRAASFLVLLRRLFSS
jgi:hypothetical protein